MKISKIVLCFVILSVLLSACTKEKKVAKKIDGVWDVTSYKIDGVEYLGIVISDATMKFEDYESRNNEGKSTWRNNLWYGGADVIVGSYSLDVEGEEIEFVLEGIEVFDMDLDEDELTLSGNLSRDGTLLEISSERQ